MTSSRGGGGSESRSMSPEALQMADHWTCSDRPLSVWLQPSLVYASRVTKMAPAEFLAHD